MIVEILVGAGLVGAGVALARALTRRAHANVDPEPEPDESQDRERAAEQVRDGLQIDDVLLRGGSELWLAGAIVLEEEDVPVACVFHAPGGLRDAPETCWVAQLDATGKDLALLARTDELSDGRVPDELPHRGMRLTLRRRAQVQVSTEGEQLPPVTERAELTLLGGPGGRTLLVVDFHGGDRLALSGERLSHELFEVLPGGH